MQGPPQRPVRPREIVSWLDGYETERARQYQSHAPVSSWVAVDDRFLLFEEDPPNNFNASKKFPPVVESNSVFPKLDEPSKVNNIAKKPRHRATKTEAIRLELDSILEDATGPGSVISTRVNK